MSKLTPPTREQSTAILALDERGVLEGLPRQLWEGLSDNECSLFHLSEPVLLAIACIEDIIRAEKEDVEKDINTGGPPVDRRVVSEEVKNTMAISQRNTSHVPKDEHIAPLLMCHVPGSDYQLLPFAAGIGVQPMSQKEESNLGSDISQSLILLNGSRAGHKE